MTARSSGLAVFTAAPAVALFRVLPGAVLGAVDAPFLLTSPDGASLSKVSIPADAGTFVFVSAVRAMMAPSAPRARRRAAAR